MYLVLFLPSIVLKYLYAISVRRVLNKFDLPERWRVAFPTPWLLSRMIRRADDPELIGSLRALRRIYLVAFSWEIFFTLLGFGLI